MGVTQDGRNYRSVVQKDDHDSNEDIRYVVKRASTIEEALRGATDTELLIGRTMLMRNGKLIQIPEFLDTQKPESIDTIKFIRRKLLRLSRRALEAA